VENDVLGFNYHLLFQIPEAKSIPIGEVGQQHGRTGFLIELLPIHLGEFIPCGTSKGMEVFGVHWWLVEY
jgi:hypothetical protein